MQYSTELNQEATVYVPNYLNGPYVRSYDATLCRAVKSMTHFKIVSSAMTVSSSRGNQSRQSKICHSSACMLGTNFELFYAFLCKSKQLPPGSCGQFDALSRPMQVDAVNSAPTTGGDFDYYPILFYSIP